MNVEFAKALIAAQKEMPAIKPDSVGVWKNDYVSLGHLLAEILPVLHKHGIGVAQFPTIHETGQPTLTTILFHDSGDKLEYVAPLFLEKQDPQKHGSAITYVRRYALASALGVSDQKDDDGEAASVKSEPEAYPKPPAPEMAARPTMTPEEAAAYVAQQGPYKGKTIKEVYAEDPLFVSRVAENEKPSKAREAAQIFLASIEADSDKIPF